MMDQSTTDNSRLDVLYGTALLGTADKFKLNVWYGTVELQQRPVVDGNRFGYESRSIWRDRSDVVQKTSEWERPVCWLVTPELEKPARSWWSRLWNADKVCL
jgi:hypothetical protein